MAFQGLPQDTFVLGDNGYSYCITMTLTIPIHSKCARVLGIPGCIRDPKTTCTPN